MPLLDGLSEEEWGLLEARMRHFLGTKHISGAHGAAVSEQQRLVIAAQACLPILHLGDEAYAGWHELIVYPGAFKSRDSWRDRNGLVHEGERSLAGMARTDGPMLVSWKDSQHGPWLDGWNVVIHECAHKLDMLNGDANGAPPLHAGMSQEDWSRIWDRAYRDFCYRVDAGIATGIDAYGAENPAEFFAVLSECFFELPHRLHLVYPAVYEQLRQFYRQDPGMRLPVVGVDDISW